MTAKGRKALVVGIDHYAPPVPKLVGAVNDARNVFGLLDRHEDESKNFHCQLLVSEAKHLISRNVLRQEIRKLFEGKGEICLLYFAGHGYTEDTGGYLCSSDSESGDDGIALQDIMTWANSSEFQNRVIILDSCHSGEAAARSTERNVSEISEGVTILTASTTLPLTRSAIREPPQLFPAFIVARGAGARSLRIKGSRYHLKTIINMRLRKGRFAGCLSYTRITKRNNEPSRSEFVTSNGSRRD